MSSRGVIPSIEIPRKSGKTSMSVPRSSMTPAANDAKSENDAECESDAQCESDAERESDAVGQSDAEGESLEATLAAIRERAAEVEKQIKERETEKKRKEVMLKKIENERKRLAEMFKKKDLLKQENEELQRKINTGLEIDNEDATMQEPRSNVDEAIAAELEHREDSKGLDVKEIVKEDN